MSSPAAPPSPPGAPRPWWETRAFVVAMVLLAAVPLLYPPIPPLVDLLGHMGRYRVQLDLEDSAYLQQYYDFQWSLMGNLGVDLLVALLAPVLGLEMAVKLIVISIPMATVAGMLWVAREVHHRLPPTVMFALPFAYGHHFLFGFVNFSLSVALALLAFGLWLRLGRQRRYRLRALLFVPISLVVWLCHAFGWGMLGLLAVSAEVVRNHDDGRGWLKAIARALLHVAVLTLPLLLMMAWRDQSGGETQDWFNWSNKLTSLRSALRDRWRTWDTLSVVFPVVIIFFAIIHPRLTLSRMLGFTALVFAAAFAMLPRIIFGSAYADMRLVPFLFAFALLAIRFRDAPDKFVAKIIALAALAFLLARTVTVTWSLALAANEQRGYLAALDKVPMGARVLSMAGVHCRERAWPLWRNGHIGGLVIVRRQGLVNNHWENPGAKLLTNTYLPARDFRYDPSQLVREPGCPLSHASPVDRQLARFPRQAFDYVWLVDPPRFNERLLAPAELIYRGPRVFLYRLRPEPSAGTRPQG